MIKAYKRKGHGPHYSSWQPRNNNTIVFYKIEPHLMAMKKKKAMIDYYRNKNFALYEVSVEDSDNLMGNISTIYD